MRVLLVEPAFRKQRPSAIKSRCSDEVLWYPPLGLMKLATYHKQRGDQVRFVSGCDKSILPNLNLFDLQANWDRVYISTLFTFHFKNTVETIKFYTDAVGGTLSKIFVGGIMATLMAEELHKATNVQPIKGILHSPAQIGLSGDVDIDMLAPDYNLLDNSLYAIRDTYYAYTTRGCINHCGWCGVPKIEPDYLKYIDIKPMIKELRKTYGDKPVLKLMDNNVLASSKFEEIVDDLVSLGYSRGQFTDSLPKKSRVIDFNQGLDASFITRERMQHLSKLNIRPMRIAFDRVTEKAQYIKALEIAHEYGVPEFSNYMLYNYKDSPKDLYERLIINIELNEKWLNGKLSGKIYSYPMRYAPIRNISGEETNKFREAESETKIEQIDWYQKPAWNKRFTRNIEIIKGAAHGAISPTPSLARRAIGNSFHEYISNLYMPEVLLRNRNAHEKKIYSNDPKRKPGSGLVEKFREFIMVLIKKQDAKFYFFHNAVSANSAESIRTALIQTKDAELKKWLQLYVKDTNGKSND
jgi:hypothetical protein